MSVTARPAAAVAPDARVTVGNPGTPFSQNKQNEPAVAIDPNNPNIVAAGANENIDLEACNAGNPKSCPFTNGVGVSGIYFSVDSGKSWTQPTYSGWSARGCLGPAPCAPGVGPIGTLPKYFENGLVSNGDAALAFGPRPGPSGFSWSNGSRLYYANIATNSSTARDEQSFKGFGAIAVSRTDDVVAAAAGDARAWKDPVIVTKQNSALFSDKEAIWVDNAASSPHFGNVYVCDAAFRSIAGAPEPIMFARSTDGGDTWTSRQLSSATDTSQTGGRQFCTIRTDSNGTVYVYWIGTDIRTRNSVFFQTRSFDGGVRFERPRVAVDNVIECGLPDVNTGRNSMDGVAGARAGSAPSVDIASGAPTGTGATNQIVLTWCQGPTPSATSPGPNETAAIRTSTDRGDTFVAASAASASSDRPFFPAIAIAPNGTSVYVTYSAFLQPWQHTTANPRLMQGVVRSASVNTTTGAIGAWSDLHRGPTGDARGSSQNNLVAEFLGDYNYAWATNTFVVAVWNDVRGAADCPAIDAYRQMVADGTATASSTDPNRPSPNTDCPATFGNSDIFSFTSAP